MFRAKDVMTTSVVSVTPDTSMRRAGQLLVEHGVSGLPVVESDGHVTGVITEFDLLQLVYDVALEDHRVADHMSQPALTIDEDATLTDVADLFLSQPVRRVPVLRHGKMVGVISRHDLMRFVSKIRQRVRQTVSN